MISVCHFRRECTQLKWSPFAGLGFAMLCAGAVRRKNVQNTMLKNLLDAVRVTAYFVQWRCARHPSLTHLMNNCSYSITL